MLGAEPVPEYDLKAAFVYNFALFTEWPAAAAFEGGYLNICVNPSSPLRPALSALADKPVQGKRLAVRALASVDGARACHVLVLGASDRGRWLALLRAVRGAPVLTVADDQDGNYEGAMLSLGLEGGRVAFDVDTRAARRAQLRLSSKLLRLGRMVQ